ncbi:class I SAM-dependent methyltransferase [soil metagenome]
MMNAQVSDLHRLFATRWHRHYSRTKLRTDPLYAAVFDELADSAWPVLDVGCGLGLFAFYLRTRGFAHGIVGIDYDRAKIIEAQGVARSRFEGITFTRADAREGIPSFSGNVTVLDILQFFRAAERETLLRAVAQNVAPGGKLILRTCLRDGSWRFRVSMAGDLFARLTFWMRSAPVDYPTADELSAVAHSEGLAGKFVPLWGRTPFNNYLGVFSRPG